jgi:hypothetical protein
VEAQLEQRAQPPAEQRDRGGQQGDRTEEQHEALIGT